MMTRVYFLKFLDKVIGCLAVKVAGFIPQSNRDSRSLLTSVLFIRPGGIGDAVHLIPVINHLKKLNPGGKITVLAEKRNSAIFSLCPAVGEVFLYDRPLELLTALRGSYDVVIDTEQWHRLSAVVARLTRAPLIIGYGTNERKRLFTRKIAYSHSDYEVGSFFNLLAPMGIARPDEITTPFLAIPEEAGRHAETMLGNLVTKQSVVIFPGASIPERRWGADKFGDVAERLHQQGINVVVVGGKEDASDGDRIVAGGHGLNLAGKTSLTETAAIIEKAALLLSGDSGILHIGVGLGKPTVSLFGPGIAKKWAPRGGKHIVINKNLTCSPCTKFGSTPKCPINARCMTEITVDEVIAAVEKMIKRFECER